MSKITKDLKVKLEKLKKIKRGKKSRKNKRTKTKKNKSQRGGNEEKDEDYIMDLFIKAKERLNIISDDIERLNYSATKCQYVYNYFLIDEYERICNTNESESRGQFYCDINVFYSFLYDVKDTYTKSSMIKPTEYMERFRTGLIDHIHKIRGQISNLYDFFVIKDNEPDNVSYCGSFYIDQIFKPLEKAYNEIERKQITLKRLFERTSRNSNLGE